jgi:predicted ester cyclase
VTTSANKAAVHRLYSEVFTEGDIDVIAELLAEEYIGYDPPNSPRAMYGQTAMRQSAERMATAFPDRRYTINELIAEDNLVAARVTMAATHTGQFFDPPPDRTPNRDHRDRDLPTRSGEDRRQLGQLGQLRADETVGGIARIMRRVYPILQCHVPPSAIASG